MGGERLRNAGTGGRERLRRKEGTVGAEGLGRRAFAKRGNGGKGEA
jgi:hypothetical protein